jgi:hypothetical protein
MRAGQTGRHKRWIRDRLRSRGMDVDLAADVKVLNSVESRLHRAETESVSTAQPPRTRAGTDQSQRHR